MSISVGDTCMYSMKRELDPAMKISLRQAVGGSGWSGDLADLTPLTYNSPKGKVLVVEDICSIL